MVLCNNVWSKRSHHYISSWTGSQVGQVSIDTDKWQIDKNFHKAGDQRMKYQVMSVRIPML